MLQGNQKIVYDKVNINIATGNSSFALNTTLREGTCIGVKLVDISSATQRDHAINVGVEDNSGTEVIGSTDFRDYTAGNGGYINSLKPAQFSTRSGIKIQATATEAIKTADFKAQLIFAIVIEK